MKAIFNISTILTPETAAKASKKGYRSSGLNDYRIEAVDFDNELHTLDIEAVSYTQAAAKAERQAREDGFEVNYMNIYKV